MHSGRGARHVQRRAGRGPEGATGFLGRQLRELHGGDEIGARLPRHHRRQHQSVDSAPSTT